MPPPPSPVRPHMRSAKSLARRKAAPTGYRRFKLWARFWVVPPALWEIGRRFVRRELAASRALSPPEHPTPLVNILFPQPGPLLAWIPVEKILSHFGQSFTTEQHHFVRYLESGFHDLERFYRSHQPQTALQAHFVNETLPGISPAAGVGGTPWKPATQLDNDTPLRRPESFGPVSDLELATEAARLDKVRHSIKKYGFFAGHALQPGGQITGLLFYKDNGDFRVVIDGGNHRTAVLAHLGWDLIPVHNRAGFHPVRLSDLTRWPGVLDGRFTPESARAMFEAYFRPVHQRLLPGW